MGEQGTVVTVLRAPWLEALPQSWVIHISVPIPHTCSCAAWFPDTEPPQLLPTTAPRGLSLIVLSHRGHSPSLPHSSLQGTEETLNPGRLTWCREG